MYGSTTAGRHRWVTVGSVAAALCWLAAMTWVGGQIGWVGVLAGVLLSAPLAAIALAVFRWVGRWTPLPPRLRWGAFLWGATFAAAASIPLDPALQTALGAVAGPGSIDLLGPLVATPVSEELLKGLFVVGVLVVASRRIRGLVDGVVVAGLTAAGFAFTENVLYLGRPIAAVVTTHGDPAAVVTAVATFVLRAAALPLHPVFTCPIGIGVAIAVTRRSRVFRVVSVTLGFLVGIALHAVFDTTALVGGDVSFLGMVYAFVMLPAMVVLGLVVTMARRRDGLRIGAQVPRLPVHR